MTTEDKAMSAIVHYVNANREDIDNGQDLPTNADLPIIVPNRTEKVGVKKISLEVTDSDVAGGMIGSSNRDIDFDVVLQTPARGKDKVATSDHKLWAGLLECLLRNNSAFRTSVNSGTRDFNPFHAYRLYVISAPPEPASKGKTLTTNITCRMICIPVDV